MSGQTSIHLPEPSAIQKPVPIEEFLQIKEQYDSEHPLITLQTKFNLAWALVCSENLQQVQQGLTLFCTVYRDFPERRLETLYYIALTQYKIKQYEESRRYLNMLLAKDPSNPQALRLKSLLYNAVTTEGYIGMAVVAGAVVSAAALVGWASKRMFSRRR
ncbi:fission protein Fis1 [Schizosaccharomyces octosporus yFS286]|uniref:Mitochondrial fission 1 protein n=1 Tax=Schizosaccharomyces octosporus (strain yFS286) TaxID=483514 RepID=S9RJ10_SCHOY|nr:fission protein Fis1 [Schizosaccharomyces octosporus yFS286]EPX73999.1 fission protein Fis1 [Schizosaccharomyces octosporus yFS286]